MRFGNPNEGERVDVPQLAKEFVQKQYNTTGIGTRREEPIDPLYLDDIYVVWFCYTLGNWKAILSTMRPDDRIYEVTHDKQKGQTYVDTYVKTHNLVFADES